ncbi:dinitrogenase iron-molybdenum cofactor N-terminal domain-containing protein [Denitromonas iodatirespirans]|uniref:Dinitrogenase iron-molybdenum cofactor biosynthesis protein n=1 Tax=Denitromonas iodatirespirans TaxID=2795389 RepID=A0A944D8L6_DENI1|nr:dinitrogenase iron-molybdenum cofactor N-terminal domain-containing protein [Denitromonas iodatirespirans]MBT0960511.1 dinitrogenase iron-molybdenum cofactor biosynthesis protein [Denitromonas iodatirespirans]
MSDTPIASREAALRIALAARALDGLEIRAFVDALVDTLAAPLTERKLAGVTVDTLRELLAGDFAEQGCHVSANHEQLKRAVRLLWGEGVEARDFPVVQPYADGDMPGSLRVAVAANRGENLDGHFGSCDRFLIYQVGMAEIRLVDVRSTTDTDAADDKNAARAALIGDCQLVYVQSIGGPAAAKAVRAGVHPVKKADGGAAREVLIELQGRLASPPPWLAQIMGVPATSLARFAAGLEAEASSS